MQVFKRIFFVGLIVSALGISSVQAEGGLWSWFGFGATSESSRNKALLAWQKFNSRLNAIQEKGREATVFGVVLGTFNDGDGRIAAQVANILADAKVSDNKFYDENGVIVEASFADLLVARSGQVTQAIATRLTVLVAEDLQRAEVLGVDERLARDIEHTELLQQEQVAHRANGGDEAVEVFMVSSRTWVPGFLTLVEEDGSHHIMTQSSLGEVVIPFDQVGGRVREIAPQADDGAGVGRPNEDLNEERYEVVEENFSNVHVGDFLICTEGIINKLAPGAVVHVTRVHGLQGPSSIACNVNGVSVLIPDVKYPKFVKIVSQREPAVAPVLCVGNEPAAQLAGGQQGPVLQQAECPICADEKPCMKMTCCNADVCQECLNNSFTQGRKNCPFCNREASQELLNRLGVRENVQQAEESPCCVCFEMQRIRVDRYMRCEAGHDRVCVNCAGREHNQCPVQGCGKQLHPWEVVGE